mmetsp:Transcript_35560/g.62798  ORF Transcript_35560/g.62798 Transcript_35560/m.62798 type:complete len:517 (+) Transcript_35560:72-1622(+)
MSCCWDCYEGVQRLAGNSSDASPLKKKVRDELRFSGKMSGGSVDIRSLMLKPTTSRNWNRYYQKMSALGQGAFGAVYKVKEKSTGNIRALKEVQINSDEDQHYVLIELEAMVKLDHPNILKLYEFYESPRCLYLVTEICTGGDFGELGRSEFTEKDKSLLFRDVCVALAYCHDQGVAHRDMKFENCLIDFGQEKKRKLAKLIDFGLAGLQKGKGNRWMKEQLGTKYWVAPEVVDKKIKYGFECDMWAVGVMLFILYVDEHPMSENAHCLPQNQLLRKIERGEVRFAVLDRLRINKDLKTLIHQLLEKNPSRRITAANALKSPWFAEVEGELRSTLTSGAKQLSGMVSRLRQFRGYSKYEKAVMALVAHQKRERNVQDLKKAFLALDVERNGTLSESEIITALSDSGIQMDSKEMSEIFQALDTSEEGKVHIGEWLAATIEPKSLDSDQAMNQVFDFFDLDHTGKISREELINVLGNEQEAEEVMRQGDTSGDALISRNEFKVMMKKIVDKMVRGET